jgi:hypothetical protein
MVPVIEEKVGSTNDFADEVARRLEGRDLPDAGELRALLETAFFASLNEEEGRRPGFTLAWTTGTAADEEVFELSRPIAATPKNLAKLAPATLREATAIAVRRGPGGLVLWALLQHNETRDPPLAIHTLAPGVLKVVHRGVPRALYAGGQILLLDPQHPAPSPARRLTATFTCWSRDAEPVTHIDPRAALVTRVAARALDHGHGGMILVVPADVEPEGVRVHYPVGAGADVLLRRYAELVGSLPPAERLARIAGSRPRGPDGHVNVRDEAQLRAAEAVEFVARLTAIDNALLVDTDLRVRGFGVQVIEGQALPYQFRHEDPYSNDAHFDDLSTFKGTRHPAGVVFCLRQPGEAAAIIASQDGRLSLAMKDARGVVEVLGSYERGFGWR